MEHVEKQLEYLEIKVFVYRVRNPLGVSLRVQREGEVAMADCPNINSLVSHLLHLSKELFELAQVVAVRLIFEPPQGIVMYKDLKVYRCAALEEEQIDLLYQKINDQKFFCP